jgi:hypothetical protein
VLGTTAGLAAESSGFGGAEKLVLRLADVGHGYLVGDDSGCGGLGTENAPPSVAQLAVTYYPVPLCDMEFERLWRARGTPAKGAPFVQSTALVFPSPDAAAAALHVSGDLAHYMLAWQPNVTPIEAPLALGDQTIAMAGGRNFVLVWRTGTVVALLHVRGRSAGNARGVALALGRRQQGRIEKPTPLSPRANDDREVHLDNPRLKVPVVWLGLRFRPGRGLPSLPYRWFFGSPPYRASLQYEGERNGIQLELWTPRRWARFRRTKWGRGFWDRPCSRKRVVPLSAGRAEIFRSCSKRSPRYVAHAYLDGAVVDAGAYCLRCERGEGAYGSWKGLTAVVRGLRLRPRR